MRKSSLLAALLFLLPAIMLYAQEFPDAPDDGEQEYELGQRARRDYLEALKKNGIDAASLYQQYTQRKQWKQKTERILTTPDWEFLGPLNQSGRIMGLAVASHNPNIWYCAADGGGIWKSFTGGSTWDPLTDNLPSLKMSALSCSPFDNNLVLGGTHEGFVYRSTNGGALWQIIPLNGAPYIYDIQFHPSLPSTLFLAADDGILRSTDYGQTWQTLRAGGRMMSITINPIDPALLLCTENDKNGTGRIYRSTDNGQHWTQVHQNQEGYWGSVKVQFCAGQPDIAYATYSDANLIFKSIDGGVSWKRTLSQPYRDSYTRGFDYLAVSPTDPNIVVTGSTSMFRTMDGGVSWIAGDTVNKDMHVDQHAFLFPASMPGALLAGNDGGVFFTQDYTAQNIVWTARNTDLATLQIYNCTLHPFSNDTIIVGCQDNGYDKFTGNPYTWLVVGGDGFCTIYDHDDPRYFYHEYISYNLHRADNGFTWWAAKKMNGLPTDTSSDGFYTGIIDPDRSDWYGQGITMAPQDPKILFLGTQYLYKTTDRADHWHLVSSYNYAPASNSFITAITVTPQDISTLYVGTSDGEIFRVVEGLQVTSVNITPAGLSGRIRGIAVSRYSTDTVYMCGDNGWQSRGVYKTTNGGASWTVAATGLPKGQVNRIMIDPGDAQTLYAAHSYGLFFSRNGGATWYPMPDFPNVEVWDFDLNPTTRTLLVGTYGRGAVRALNFEAPSAPTDDVPDAHISLSKSIAITPQPIVAEATLHLMIPVATDIVVTISDMLGRKIATLYSGWMGQGKQEILLSPALTEGLGSGVYSVEVQGSGSVMQIPIMIAR